MALLKFYAKIRKKIGITKCYPNFLYIFNAIVFFKEDIPLYWMLYTLA